MKAESSLQPEMTDDEKAYFLVEYSWALEDQLLKAKGLQTRLDERAVEGDESSIVFSHKLGEALRRVRDALPLVEKVQD